MNKQEIHEALKRIPYLYGFIHRYKRMPIDKEWLEYIKLFVHSTKNECEIVTKMRNSEKKNMYGVVTRTNGHRIIKSFIFKKIEGG